MGKDGVRQGRCPFGFNEVASSRRALLLGAGTASAAALLGGTRGAAAQGSTEPATHDHAVATESLAVDHAHDVDPAGCATRGQQRRDGGGDRVRPVDVAAVGAVLQLDDDGGPAVQGVEHLLEGGDRVTTGERMLPELGEGLQGDRLAAAPEPLHRAVVRADHDTVAGQPRIAFDSTDPVAESDPEAGYRVFRRGA